MQMEWNAEQPAFLSTELAGRRLFRTAWALVLISAAVFLSIAPFAARPLGQFPVFISIYVSWLVVTDLITAILLFSQFNFLRSWSLLFLSAGYLFSALATVAYSLIFPGLFVPTGLFGSGPQTSSALYMFWHGGFPLFVLAYSKIKQREGKKESSQASFSGRIGVGVLGAVLLVALVVVAFTAFATAGNMQLPEFLSGNHTTLLGHLFLTGVWLLSLTAFIMLWVRRPKTSLDVWLMVVMSVWMFDLALSAILNSGRYDLGWYAGRIYGLLASSFLLLFLLVENSLNYGRLFQLTKNLNTANALLKQLSLNDSLTSLGNRRLFDSYLRDQMAIAKRHGRPLSFVLFDVDHFKDYNDHYGHQAGDEALRQVAAVLRDCCHRPADLAARYGGEEFALLLPDTSPEGALKIAETVRTGVLARKIIHQYASAGVYLTVSGGLASFFPGQTLAPTDFIEAADQALYRAKQHGRNRIEQT